MLRWNGKTLTLKGEKLPPERVSELKNQAIIIQQLELFQLLTNEFEYFATEKMFKEAKTLDDIIFPKAILYVMDVLKTKLANIAKLGE